MKAIGFRHIVAILVLFGIIINYMLRVNLSVAILAMVNNTALAELQSKSLNSANQSSVIIKNGTNDQCGRTLEDPAIPVSQTVAC